jgi:hypothetical protein
MGAFTLRYQPAADDREIAAANAIVAEQRGNIAWQHARTCERTYALVEGSDAACADALRAATRAHVFDRPVIALALCPSPAEALPALAAALAGAGRPEGVLGYDTEDGTAIVEWDLERTPARVILDLVDVELDRYHAGRTGELLTPLSLAWLARIAADGLHAPEVAPQRILEAQLEVQHVVD